MVQTNYEKSSERYIIEMIQNIILKTEQIT